MQIETWLFGLGTENEKLYKLGFYFALLMFDAVLEYKWYKVHSTKTMNLTKLWKFVLLSILYQQNNVVSLEITPICKFLMG